MANGRPRDELRIDIEAGRPGIAPDVDALALRCAALLDDKRSTWFWNSLEYRVMMSSARGDWMHRPMTYLQDLDPATAERIRRHVALTYEKARAAAIKRGWEVI